MSRNWAASVRARLLELSRREGQAFQLILIRYLHERLLYRLSRSAYRSHFCLKGGTLIYAWEGLASRPTKDVDLLGVGLSNEAANLQKVFREIAAIAYEEDGVTFQAPGVTTEEIAKEGTYPGIRVCIPASLDTTRERIQVDIGFGDAVVPHPVTIDYPTLLGLEAPRVRAYSVESVIAEKFEAMLDLAEANSRLKDFYDVHRLLIRGKYEPQVLSDAIRETCRRRGTTYREGHSLFTEAFAKDGTRNRQWAAFLKRAGIREQLPFLGVMQTICEQLQPLYESLRSGE